MPVHAVTHGTTSSWDYGGADIGTIPPAAPHGWADYNITPSYAYLLCGLQGNSAPYAYVNSGYVVATADVSSVTVTVFWDTSDYTIVGPSGDVEAYFQCRLYVNTVYQGTKNGYFSGSGGYEQFTFTGLDIDTGDHLDVDIWFKASAWTMQSWYEREAYFTYVGFTS